MLVAYTVIGHPARRHQAERLAAHLDAALIIDDGRGAWANHYRAWEQAPSNVDWAVFLEDDAQPVQDMHAKLSDSLTRCPQGIASLYLGTSYPTQSQAWARAASRSGLEWARAHAAWHAVALAARPTDIPGILHAAPSDKPWDEAITAAIRGRLPCWYRLPALVDHEDGTPIEKPTAWQPRDRPRKAWTLDGPLHPAFTTPT